MCEYSDGFAETKRTKDNHRVAFDISKDKRNLSCIGSGSGPTHTCEPKLCQTLRWKITLATPITNEKSNLTEEKKSLRFR